MLNDIEDKIAYLEEEQMRTKEYQKRTRKRLSLEYITLHHELEEMEEQITEVSPLSRSVNWQQDKR